jgi:hypothetical protein
MRADDFVVYANEPWVGSVDFVFRSVVMPRSYLWKFVFYDPKNPPPRFGLRPAFAWAKR